MLNYIWFGMMFIAVIVGIFTGNIDAVTEAAISMSKTAVEIPIGLIDIMALWLGTMKIAEESGLIRILSKAIRPITIRLFPDVPEDHPAIGSIVLNMAANILGLGNAATPMGLKAMEELQELNPKKDTATNKRNGGKLNKNKKRKDFKKIVHSDAPNLEAPDPRWAGELSKLKDLLANQKTPA